MDTMVDYYILETQSSINHIEVIPIIIKDNSSIQSNNQAQKKNNKRYILPEKYLI